MTIHKFLFIKSNIIKDNASGRKINYFVFFISLRIILQSSSKLLFYIESRLDKAQSAFEAMINLREFVENAIHIATESSVINTECEVPRFKSALF